MIDLVYVNAGRGYGKTFCQEEFKKCEIVKENKQLQNNWNELKKFVEEQKKVFEEWLEPKVVYAYEEVLNKMQEFDNREV